MPPGLEFVWELFLDLSTTRGAGWSPNPVTYAEIQAWAQLHKTDLEAWELDAVRKLDGVWLEVVNEHLERQRQVQQSQK